MLYLIITNSQLYPISFPFYVFCSESISIDVSLMLISYIKRNGFATMLYAKEMRKESAFSLALSGARSETVFSLKSSSVLWRWDLVGWAGGSSQRGRGQKVSARRNAHHHYHRNHRVRSDGDVYGGLVFRTMLIPFMCVRRRRSKKRKRNGARVFPVPFRAPSH